MTKFFGNNKKGTFEVSLFDPYLSKMDCPLFEVATVN